MSQVITRQRVVLIKMGAGTLEAGFPNIHVQLIDEDTGINLNLTSQLPEARELIDLYEKWQKYYLLLHERLAWSNRMLISQTDDNFSQVSEQEFQVLCGQVEYKLNDWLITRSFQGMATCLAAHLQPSDHIQVIIETDDNRLRRIPWHLWNFFNVFPHAEITLSPSHWQALPPPSTPFGTVRILAVFGSSEGINLEEDRKQLNEILKLAKADIVFLDQPSLLSFTEHLNDQRGWDILFYAGHSITDQNTGKLLITQDDYLTIPRLNNALKMAIQKGLRIAIFNSCDGLGLARGLEQLHCPRIIVMREPINDYVAHTFSRYFLKEFSSGQSFDMAVRLARQQLQGIEDSYPCASWLPVICQHLKADHVSWHDIQYNPTERNRVIQFLFLLFGIGNVSSRWWNRPLIGDQSMIDRTINLYRKVIGRPVPPSAMKSYQELILKTQRFAKIAQEIEQERIESANFKSFLQLRKAILNHRCKKLNRHIRVLEKGLQVREQYLTLARIKFEFRGRYHQIYYQFINALILERLDRADFLRRADQKYKELLPHIKTPRGHDSFKFFFRTIRAIALESYQYELLYFFKKNRDIQYKILNDLYSISFSIPTNEIIDGDALNSYIFNNQQVFDKLGRLIGVHTTWNTLEVHKLILQNTAYVVNHNLKYSRNVYMLLLERLRGISPIYQQIQQFRQEYCGKGYTLNLELIKPVPGIELFNRYKDYL